MICPQCGVEYKDGFTDCADCHIPLIKGTAKEWERKEEFVRLVPVYSTGNLAFVAVAKSVLEGAGILFNVKNENLQNLWGLGSLGTGYSPLTGPMIIEVEKERAEEAKALLQELDSGGFESLEGDWDDEGK